MCHIYAKELLDSNFNEAAIYNLILSEIAPKSIYSQKHNF